MCDEELYQDLVTCLSERGASLTACADLAPVAAESRHHLPRAVCIGVALDTAVVKGIKNGPTPAYAAEYKRLNELLAQLADQGAEFLQQRGYRAIASAPSMRDLKATLASVLPHKTVGTLAGLGWVGHSALLINKEYGPAVRWNTVLTDAPLPVGTPVSESLCGDCRLCVDSCPPRAISGRAWRAGIEREEIYDAFACRDFAVKLAAPLGVDRALCGICIAACPYTEKYVSRAAEPD